MKSKNKDLEISSYTLYVTRVYQKINSNKKLKFSTLSIFVSLIVITVFLVFSHKLSVQDVQAEHKENKSEKINEELRMKIVHEDVKKLTDIPYQKNVSIAPAVHIYSNFKKYMNQEEKTDFTKSLIHIIREDLNYNNKRHVEFLFYTITNWDDYREQLKTDLELNSYIINNNIIPAIKRFRKENSIWFYDLRYKPDRWSFPNYPWDANKSAHFVSLVKVFSLHIALMNQSSKKFKANLNNFWLALDNPYLFRTLVQKKEKHVVFCDHPAYFKKCVDIEYGKHPKVKYNDYNYLYDYEKENYGFIPN
ncbi:MAG: hypothetical protein H7A23_11265 [Leptospiraceae bacterium]|nr:hypothetical protein [Leptospiraceae bacterium]MCP5495124.1 hypothetical protein [Leptospiraceae bacterium]